VDASGMFTCTGVTADVGRCTTSASPARTPSWWVAARFSAGRDAPSPRFPAVSGQWPLPSCSCRPWKPPLTSSERGTVPTSRDRLPRTGPVQAGSPSACRHTSVPALTPRRNRCGLVRMTGQGTRAPLPDARGLRAAQSSRSGSSSTQWYRDGEPHQPATSVSAAHRGGNGEFDRTRPAPGDHGYLHLYSTPTARPHATRIIEQSPHHSGSRRCDGVAAEDDDDKGDRRDRGMQAPLSRIGRPRCLYG
jgi:hypothetical protein